MDIKFSRSVLVVFLAACYSFYANAAERDVPDIERLAAQPYHGFELILQIDKSLQGTSLHAQRIRVYRYRPDTGEIGFIARWYVSTGVEAARENRIGRVTPRTTLTGYYPVEVLRAVAYSNSWDGMMLYSMFYDVPGGYAIHATEPNKYGRLGRRASGGCTRLEQKQARYLYRAVAEMGKGWTLKLDRETGEPVLDGSGRPMPQWTHKALVLIEDGSILEATRLGFVDRNEVYKSLESLAHYTGQSTPSGVGVAAR